MAEEFRESASERLDFRAGRYPPRRRVCAFCVDKVSEVDYKQADQLRSFLSDRGRILARRATGTCAKHQRQLAKAIKRARFLGLLPYVAASARRG